MEYGTIGETIREDESATNRDLEGSAKASFRAYWRRGAPDLCHTKIGKHHHKLAQYTMCEVASA